MLRHALFLFIFLLAFTLRAHESLTAPIWYDEAFTLVTVRGTFADMNAILAADVHPPLYSWLTWGVDRALLVDVYP